MDKRKRKLSDIGKQLGVKVRKQDINYYEVEPYFNLKTLKDEEDIFTATSLVKTEHNLRSNGFERGRDSEVFTKAVIQVNTKKQSTISSGINSCDIKGNVNDGHSQKNGTKNNSKIFVRDDSGYQSEDLCESLSSSDSDETVKPEYYGHNINKTDSVRMPLYQGSNKCAKAGTFDNNCNMNDNQDRTRNICTKTQICESTPISELDEITDEVFGYDPDESDVIIPSECTDVITDKRPKPVDKRWARNSLESDVGKQLFKTGKLKRRISLPDKLRRTRSIEPIQKWTIYIPHEYANKPIGDEFGADVWTYQTTQKDGTVYNQHFFVNVKPDGPAAKMKIHDNDEIVLLNAIFVPNVIHAEVLNIFRDVKVDGKTRFKLVLRRLEKIGSKKDWEWVETSAILAPDCRRDLDNYPEVEKPILNTLKGNEYVKKSNHYYKVPGTQSYLDIKQDSVVADVLTNTDADKTKIICRIDHYKFNMETEKFDFTAALFSETVSKYIVVGQEKQIRLDDNPMWFEMTTVRPHIMFKINGLFLACNTETLTIETRASEYMFEEEPVDEVYDHPDHSMPMPCDDKLQCDAEDVKDDSKSTAEHTKMRLEIPENNLFYGRRSSEILKTPTTPFNSLFIVN